MVTRDPWWKLSIGFAGGVDATGGEMDIVLIRSRRLLVLVTGLVTLSLDGRAFLRIPEGKIVVD